ncbi:hypothetical protein EG329_003949 [Mollisiaceae sp. DMI_Dod_QoI]|nr:hypothetical protein EG329_003949 [Helotiales sp. DMI_Dod_QoI]
MGLIRDALGSALGSNQVNNGFGGGPRLPLRPPGPRGPSHDYGMQSPRQDYPVMGAYPGRGYQSIDKPLSDQMQQRYNNYHEQYSQPPRYEPPPSDRRNWNQGQYYDGQYNDLSSTRDVRYSRNGGFRPLALPQIAYGDGQPFLRGYSNDLVQYGISPEEFMQVLDAINVAIIPNPENQIFQKGANIAGWFLPGAAGIGLAVGQLGAGIGSAVGHSSLLSQALSDANLRLFVPNGLEICIGKTTDVDAEVGIASASGQSNSFYGLSPEERQAYYGDLIAPLSRVLPPLQQSGRSDPIAMLGRGLANRGNQKKMKKAEKGIAKGKTKDLDSLEGGLKWLMVRKASANALAYWEKTLQQNNAPIR